jgi:hypothetical protein
MPTPPYYLRPEDTHLPEGHDETLDPPEAPTDPARRTVPAFEWPSDAPAPSFAPFRHEPPPESADLVTLDPDIALWPGFQVSIWPFAGPPTTGTWPTGWMGIDQTGLPWVCVAGGAPGSWVSLGTTASSGATPIGAFMMILSNAAPPNWLLMNGQTVSGGVATYPGLAAFYPAWVAANGTDLNIPSMAGVFAVGAGGAYGLGARGGSVTLTAAQIPSLSGTVSATTSVETAPHNHSFPSTNIVTEAASTVGLDSSPTIQALGITGLITGSENTQHQHTFSTSVTVGSGSPAPSPPPWVGVNYIVRAA